MQTQKSNIDSRLRSFIYLCLLLGTILSYTRAAIVGDYIDIVAGALALVYIVRYLIRLAIKKKTTRKESP